MASYWDELLFICEKIQGVTDKYKAEYDNRKIDWLPAKGGSEPSNVTELRRRRRGSARWAACQMQTNEKLHWYDHFTGRRHNVNPDVSGDEPIWHFETFKERILAETTVICIAHGMLDIVVDKPNGEEIWLHRDMVDSVLSITVEGA